MSETSSITNSGKFPSSSSHRKLPLELEREISEIAAFNFPKCIPNLILVAHRFKIWIEPVLYRIVVSGDETCLPPLYVAQAAQPEGSDWLPRVLDKARIAVFGHHVQHVLIWAKSQKEITEILECFPNVSNLGLGWTRGSIWDPLIPILENLPLRKLSFNPFDTFPEYLHHDIPFSRPLFFNITHLQLFTDSTPSWSNWKQLALLPKLTHLAIYLDDVTQEFVDRVLEECRALELLVLFFGMMDIIDNSEFPQKQKDDRLVCLDSNEDMFYDWKRWEQGARGGENNWVKAQIVKEEKIQARKRNATPVATGPTSTKPSTGQEL